MLIAATGWLCAGLLTPAADAPLEGYWEGVIVRQNATLGLRVDFTVATDGIKAVIDIPDLYLHGYTLTNVRYESPALHFELPLSGDPDNADSAVASSGSRSARRYVSATALMEGRISGCSTGSSTSSPKR